MNEAHVLVGEDGVARCWWAATPDEYVAYHDDEWGFPVDDDNLLFEKLCLEGFQSGLSWLTILRKRPAFRRAFHGFDYGKVAGMGDGDVARLMQDASIVRHRGKIEAVIHNARCAVEMAGELGSLGAFFWSFEPDPGPVVLASTTPESQAMAKELKRRGFRFVGPTTAHAFMQAMGIVNDHLDGCDVRDVVTTVRASFRVPTARGVG